MRSFPERRALAPLLKPAALVLTMLLASCAVPRPETPTPRSRPTPAPARPLPPPKPQGPAADTPVKIGKPYQVAGLWYYPADTADYDEVGLASWYGAQFHGGQTANGELFDMDRVGAAHKTLPLPSYAEVTALNTGRTIVVRINDRGPFVNDRIIDLSRRSAQLLGIERSGVARVRVRRVYPVDADRIELRWGRPASERPYAGTSDLATLRQRLAAKPVEPNARPRVAAAIPDAAIPVGGWFIQVAAVGSRARAEEIAEMVAGRIEPAGPLWRIRTGPYKTQPDATTALAQVQSDGYQEARLVLIPANSKPVEGIIPQ